MKKALITGFSSGIGLAYAKHLIKNNWHLDLVSQDIERSKLAIEALNSSNCSAYSCDLSSPNDLETLLLKISTPDLLIAKAGIGRNGSVGKN